MSGYGLSKSRLIAWKQCPKRLWLQIHRKYLLEISDETEQAFKFGYEVGEVAQCLVDVPDRQLPQNHRQGILAPLRGEGGRSPNEVKSAIRNPQSAFRTSHFGGVSS